LFAYSRSTVRPTSTYQSNQPSKTNLKSTYFDPRKTPMSNTVAHSDDPQARIEQMIQNDQHALQEILYQLVVKVKLASTEKPQAYQDFKVAVKTASEQ
jgi:phosphatidate phosphatase APP1